MTKEQYLAAVDETKEHIQAGDVFQLVLSQRFSRQTQADPFDIYRCELEQLVRHIGSSTCNRCSAYA